MPRLTNPDYLAIHFRLVGLWQTDRSSFGELNFSEQRHLHDYFHPSELVSAPDILAHRKEVTLKHPSLPQQAGKALRKLDESRAAYATPPTAHPQSSRKHAKKGRGEIIVRRIAQPELDVDKIAQALLRAADDLASNKADNPK